MGVPKIMSFPAIRRGVDSGSRASGGASSSEHSLDAILSTLPNTPESQLDCGLEILRRAFTQRVAELEDENKEVREAGKEKMSQAQLLEQRVAQLEKSIEEMTAQATDLAKEHQTLNSERDALSAQQKKISSNVKALVAFKKNCSSFLDHKDDFDVDTIHDSLPAHLRELVEPDETPRGSGMTELRSLFEMLDKDSNGKVSSKEWGSQIRRNQAALSKHFGGASLSEIGRKFRQVDADGDGSLSWEEVQQAALLASGVKPVPQAPKFSREGNRGPRGVGGNRDGRVQAQ